MGKTKVEILNDTIEYYKTHDRGVVSKNGVIGGCTYDNGEGGQCAVGCRMTKKAIAHLTKTDNLNQITVSNLSDENDSIDHLLQKKYRGHNLSFWEQLQSLHDSERNWSKTDEGWELSMDGEIRYAQFLGEYA